MSLKTALAGQNINVELNKPSQNGLRIRPATVHRRNKRAKEFFPKKPDNFIKNGIIFFMAKRTKKKFPKRGKKIFSPSAKKKGFSLIEVLASILLLAGLISFMAQISYGNVRRIKKARQLEKAASLLELKMAELKEEFKGSSVPKLPPENKGEFEEEENYFWSYETQALTLPSSEILLSLARIPENELHSKMAETLTDVLSQSVVELKLTVHYEGKRNKNFSYSLISYFINYEDAPDFILNRVRELLPAGADSL